MEEERQGRYLRVTEAGNSVCEHMGSTPPAFLEMLEGMLSGVPMGAGGRWEISVDQKSVV